jgi:carbamoyl-phosphate synthase large subunit
MGPRAAESPKRASIQLLAVLTEHSVGEPPYRVLVFPAGTEIGLEIQRALGLLKEIDLVGAGSSQDIHGPPAYRQYRMLPAVGEPGWLDALRAVVAEESIDFIFPAHDDVMFALAEHASDLGSRVVASPPETIRLARSKRATYAALAGAVPVPRVFAGLAEIDAFPVFVKPDRGEGSRGAAVVSSADELRHWVDRGSDLIMEHLPGDEFTVDCFSDRDHGLLFARGRLRIRTRAGISVQSRASGDQERFAAYGERIAQRLELRGAWFFQLRDSRDGVPTLLEVGPRIAGTMALHRTLGINFPLLSIYEALRVPIELLMVQTDVTIDRPLTNRYSHSLSYSAVYVDLDDTLLVRGAVNIALVTFLFQCVNEGRRLVLLTRHRLDIETTLAAHRLSGLWDAVIHVADGVSKADYIAEPDAILIDDSFRERRDAHARLGINTFDSAMLELLVDHRA